MRISKVLVLGAGLVAKPLVRYLLDHGYEVVLNSLVLKQALELIDNHPLGKAKEFNVKDENSLKKEVSEVDIVISMLPYSLHPTVAQCCIMCKKNMVTTSYVSKAMTKLNDAAKNAGILILNELGLDPGIDHMEAMRIIQAIEAAGGKISNFTSYCGGLPAPESNNNPFGYKFSWRPIGVLLAGKNSAEYKKDGKNISISSADLFLKVENIHIEGLGEFEGYPNRNSLPYIELYGIQSTKTILRGTLRNIGWCSTLKSIVDLHLLDQEKRDWTGFTYAAVLRDLMNYPDEQNLKRALGQYLNIDENSKIIDRLEWLGLLEESPLSRTQASAFDIIGDRMREKLQYQEGERDMIILQHTFEADFPNGKRERIMSTLIDFGIPFGDSSMSRTVGLPPAIGTRLLLEGKINITGVHIPVNPEIYVPILAELKELGIEFKENKETL